MQRILTRKTGAALGLIIISIIGLLTVTVVIPLADPTQDKADYNVKVVSFHPTEVVTKPTNITLVFSRDLVPDDGLDILFADPPIEFQPPLPGLAKWIDKNKLRYYPDSMLLPSTEYSVRVKSEKTYLLGNRINENRVFKFRTPPFAVGDIRTEIINIPDPPFESRLLIHISFNYAVDLNQFQERFSSEQETPATRITLTSESFDAGKIHGKFGLKIEKGLNCVGGNIPLAFDY